MKTKSNARHPRSLTTTLTFAFFGLSALVLLIASGLQILLNVRAHQEAIFNQEQSVARSAALKIGAFLDEKSTVLSTVGWQINPNEAPSTTQTKLLTSLLTRQPDFQQLVLFDAQNNETAQATRTQGNSAATYTRFTGLITDNILSQAQNGKRFISSVYYDEFTSVPLVAIVVPATDALGNFRGTLAAELNLVSIWRPVNELDVEGTGYVYIVDSQGNLIAFRDTNRVLEGENVSQITAVKKFIESPNKSAGIAADVESYPGLIGTKVLGAYVSLGAPEWAVVVELPTSEAYGPIVQSTIGSAGVILLMAVLAAVAGLMLARRLTIPLVNLTSTASRIAAGEMQLQATVGGAQEIAGLAMAFNTMTSQLRDLIGSLEQRVADRTSELEESTRNVEKRASQLEAIADVANSVASLQNVDELLPYITRTISDRFGFYHTGIFLLSEDKEYAVLRAANSEGGQKMLARKHQLRVGQEGVVGHSIAQKRAHIALDVGEDAVFFDNPDLPATRSELALPLLIGSDVIGALDVQSEQSNAFNNEDIEALTTLANQVAVAIENARLFQQSQNALQELDKTFQRYVSNEWKQFATSAKVTGYRADEAGLEPITNVAKDKERSNGNKSAQKIPIKLRGTTLGMLSIDLGERTRTYTEEESSLIKTVADRLALALESARLLEDSQRAATKEQIIAEITGKIGSSINLRNVLQTAVEELGHAIPGSEVVIHLDPKTDSEAKQP